jgi:hypothetical protein
MLEVLQGGIEHVTDSRTCGYLPHLEVPDGTYFLTFRSGDSFPSGLLQKWKTELMSKRTNPQKSFVVADEYEKKDSVLFRHSPGKA